MATPKLTLITTNKQLEIKNYQKLSRGIHLRNGSYVPPGAIITNQSLANSLSSVRQQKSFANYGNYKKLKPTHLSLIKTEHSIQPACLAV